MFVVLLENKLLYTYWPFGCVVIITRLFVFKFIWISLIFFILYILLKHVCAGAARCILPRLQGVPFLRYFATRLFALPPEENRARRCKHVWGALHTHFSAPKYAAAVGVALRPCLIPYKLVASFQYINSILTNLIVLELFSLLLNTHY